MCAAARTVSEGEKPHLHLGNPAAAGARPGEAGVEVDDLAERPAASRLAHHAEAVDHETPDVERRACRSRVRWGVGARKSSLLLRHREERKTVNIPTPVSWMLVHVPGQAYTVSWMLVRAGGIQVMRTARKSLTLVRVGPVTT